ncbi:MAG: Selenoprotein O and cysteine-containing homologs [uncultured Sulfurovum sp.]|uniref:Protein nucleotidyltransferase YdiU n=1 Tax=uncultured Sulfurovum sp. TaxID=269237 RepID=A0A6S6SQ72_9BACT|nr:MAG: Selenoprotein O and cysteine-containing homologs [uncultured Sulfurovum sp.]
MNTTTNTTVETLEDFAQHADYSLMNTLTPNPDATEDGLDYQPREVFSGHFVPVKPTRIKNPKYVSHSTNFFSELGLSDSLATSEPFMKMFSGDTSALPEPLSKLGWATGYALTIYGTEYYEQCPFRTGNAYGDGRAMSIFEGVLNGKRWEMQLKGGGKTPYCRGADGRAVLRSSVREFLAQEHMHALGIETSRSLTFYASETETVKRPWFYNGSYSRDPEVMIDEAVAISTRVAPSFLRVGQIELFGRRARKNEYPNALKELEQIVLHAIEREYSEEIDQSLPLEEKILLLAQEFRKRLTLLIANWVRVGYCQGNFNSDNCSVGGFGLDYGPFGFMDVFDPRYQSWTGGGIHFSFLNQPKAAERNFGMFCLALKPLLEGNQNAQDALEKIKSDFPKVMQSRMIKMWASKLGLQTFDTTLFNDLMRLMIETSVDYTIFFRELSFIPNDIALLAKSFYGESVLDKKLMDRWSQWLEKWQVATGVTTDEERETLSTQMKAVNPKYTLREWFLVPAYKLASRGDYSLIHELQEVMNNPYEEQSKKIEEKYYREKPSELFDVAGVSYVSCSS